MNIHINICDMYCIKCVHSSPLIIAVFPLSIFYTRAKLHGSLPSTSLLVRNRENPSRTRCTTQRYAQNRGNNVLR